MNDIYLYEGSRFRRCPHLSLEPHGYNTPPTNLSRKTVVFDLSLLTAGYAIHITRDTRQICMWLIKLRKVWVDSGITDQCTVS